MKPSASPLIAVASRISRSAHRNRQSPRESREHSEPRGRVFSSKSKFLLLSEEQNAAFDMECHSQEELETKFLVLDEFIKAKPFKVLDLGGGSGLFADRLLAHFPDSEVTIL